MEMAKHFIFELWNSVFCKVADFQSKLRFEILTGFSFLFVR